MMCGDETTQSIRALLTRWSALFDRGHWTQLASLYTPDAHFFGGKPGLYKGSKDIQRYFALVPSGGAAIFQDEMVVSWIASDLVMFSGFVDFRREGHVRMHRMTWVVVRRDDTWQIQGHHASPMPAH
jgi:ketosteroid isomerase-like protein